MQSSQPPIVSQDFVLSSLDDPESLAQRGVERTLNLKGCAYGIFGPSEQHWLSSLPDSSLPLLDAGACYGFQTILALKSGRDVIALDMCEGHITVLQKRAANVQGAAVGRLVRTIVAELPAADMLEEASVSGILCSEVIHFFKPGQLRLQFKDFYKWLAPGGKLVVTAGAWPPRIQNYEQRGVTLWEGRSVRQVLEMLKTLSPSQLVDAAPGMVYLADHDPLKKILGDYAYCMSTVELRELAESSGFIVEDVRYYCSGKYGDERSKTDPEAVLLVAQKPN